MYLLSYLERRFKRIARYGARRYIANCAFPWHMGRGTRAQWAAHESARRERPRSGETETSIAHEICHVATREAIANGWTYVQLVERTRARVEAALGRTIHWDTSVAAEAARLAALQGDGTPREGRPAAVARSGGLRGGAASKWAQG